MFIKKDVHRTYDFMAPLLRELPFNVSLICLLSAKYQSYSLFGKSLLMISAYFKLILDVYKNAKSDFVVLREFNTVPMLFVMFFLFPFAKKLLLVVNHNFQRSVYSSFHSRILNFLGVLGVRFICFESDELPQGLNVPTILLYFPVLPDECSSEICVGKVVEDIPVVGVVGGYRPEKKMDELVELLDEVKGVCKLIGCDSQELLDRCEAMGWATVDTSSAESYEFAMRSVDILVLNYEEKAYFYRHSGVILDAICRGVIPVVPRYPLFSAQVEYPLQVGFTYLPSEGLSESIRLAVIALNSSEIREGQLWKFRDYRSISSVAKIFTRALYDIRNARV